MPEGSVRNFDEISDRLDQIIATVRSKDTSLERTVAVSYTHLTLPTILLV